MPSKCVKEAIIKVMYNEPYDLTEAFHRVTREDLNKHYPEVGVDDFSPLNWSLFAVGFISSYDNGTPYIKDWTIQNYEMMEKE